MGNETLTPSSANKNKDSYSKFIDAYKHPKYMILEQMKPHELYITLLFKLVILISCLDFSVPWVFAHLKY